MKKEKIGCKEAKTQKERDCSRSQKTIRSEAWFEVKDALFESMDPIKIEMDCASLAGRLHVPN